MCVMNREAMGPKYSQYSPTGIAQYVDNLCKDEQDRHFNLHRKTDKAAQFTPIIPVAGSAVTWYCWVAVVEKFNNAPFTIVWDNLVELNEKGKSKFFFLFDVLI